MRVMIGTSGYQYKAWRGHFYPEACKERDLLRAYAERLPTIELNNTFYRMPKLEVVRRWVSEVPDTFRFAIKSPKRVTHVLRLRQAGQAIAQLFGALDPLGDKLGCVLFQLPPSFRRDAGRLREFLQHLPVGPRVSFEFRDETWHDPEILDLLREHRVALCCADLFAPALPLQATTDFGYLRLRGGSYSDEELAALRDQISEQAWREVFVYFKDEAVAPELARRFATLFERQGPGVAKATVTIDDSMLDAPKAAAS